VLPVVRTPRAQQDFEAIVECLDEHSPPAAHRFATAVADKCCPLASFPRMGRARDELYPGLRSLVVGNYLVFYRVTATAVEILRILHGARDLPTVEWEPEEP
jgi:toxin ParE1/3/4